MEEVVGERGGGGGGRDGSAAIDESDVAGAHRSIAAGSGKARTTEVQLVQPSGRGESVCV